MNDSIRRFKHIIAQVREDSGVNFFHYGLRDLLLEAGGNPTPAELIARAAISFCKEDDRFNGSEPGLMVVMEFLAETSTSHPQTVENAAPALVALLDKGAEYKTILKWATQFYKD